MVARMDQVSAFSRVQHYVATGDSCSGLRMKYDVDIREFVVLSCINDVQPDTCNEVAEVLSLSLTTVDMCVDSLVANGLLNDEIDGRASLRLTVDGLALLRKASM